VRAWVAGATAIVEVSDAGPGMAPEVAAQVFDRFYRADPSRARNRGGTGLGMAITESIVVAHGGTVALSSTVGVGTVVRVELPLAGPSVGGDTVLA